MSARSDGRVAEHLDARTAAVHDDARAETDHSVTLEGAVPTDQARAVNHLLRSELA